MLCETTGHFWRLGEAIGDRALDDTVTVRATEAEYANEIRIQMERPGHLAICSCDRLMPEGWQDAILSRVLGTGSPIGCHPKLILGAS